MWIGGGEGEKVTREAELLLWGTQLCRGISSVSISAQGTVRMRDWGGACELPPVDFMTGEAEKRPWRERVVGGSLDPWGRDTS